MAGTLKNRVHRPATLLGVALAAVASSVANAHFQLLYTPQAALREAAALPFALVFSHPFDNGFTMDMGRPEAFYVVSNLLFGYLVCLSQQTLIYLIHDHTIC